MDELQRTKFPFEATINGRLAIVHGIGPGQTEYVEPEFDDDETLDQWEAAAGDA